MNWSFRILCFVLVFVWWGCSAWNAISSKTLLQQHGGSSCVSIIAVASNVPGLLLIPVLRIIQKRGHFSDFCEFPPGRQLILLSFTHSVGLYAAYKGLVEGKVSFVQTMKALEPLIAVCFSVCFLRSFPTLDSLSAMMVVIAGVFFVCVRDLSISASSWVLLSSLVTQGRNQLLKLYQKKKLSLSLELEPSDPRCRALQGLVVFVASSAGAFPFNFIMALLEKPQLEICNNSLALEAGVSHFLYNLASFGILAMVSPATHSLANTTKRAVIVGCSAFFLREKFSKETSVGLCLVALGSIWYSISAKSELKTRKKFLVVMGFLLFLPVCNVTVSVRQSFNPFLEIPAKSNYNEYFVWMFPFSPLQIKGSLSLYSTKVICAYSNACGDIGHKYEKVNLRDITRGTRFQNFIRDHSYHKIRQGVDFMYHIQAITTIVLLHQDAQKGECCK